MIIELKEIKYFETKNEFECVKKFKICESCLKNKQNTADCLKNIFFIISIFCFLLYKRTEQLPFLILNSFRKLQTNY